MKNKNPFVALIILWLCILLVSIVNCIIGILQDNNFTAIFNLALIIVDVYFLGFTCRRFMEFQEYEEYMANQDLYEEDYEEQPFNEFDRDSK